MNSFMDSEKFSHISLLGDNFYPNGLMDNSDPLIARYFDNPFSSRSNLKNMVYYAISGNHDWRDNMSAQLDHNMRTNLEWRYPTLYYSTATIFQDDSFGQQNVVFVNFDSYMHVESGYSPKFHLEKQLSYVDRALAAAARVADYIIIQMHHPFWTSGNHQVEQELIDTYHTLFLKYGVDLVLSGHNHGLEILFDSTSQGNTLLEKAQYSNAPLHVVSGSGCKLRPENNPHPQTLTQFINDVGGWATIRINDGKMKVTLNTVDKRVIPDVGVVRSRRSDRDCIKQNGFVDPTASIPCPSKTVSIADLKAALVLGDDLELTYRYGWILRWLSWVTASNQEGDGVVLLLIPIMLVLSITIFCVYVYDTKHRKGKLLDENDAPTHQTESEHPDEESLQLKANISSPMRS
eukprot:GDKJ01004175.1.p1 GENE.GDKJ01004175.1~~GDKJ01004175.1.p1  ORF type:complete len:468 (+),score=73.92 GDKJ01004175.1:191-1405(+)